MMKPVVHKIGPFTVFAGVTSMCGRAMQQHGPGGRFSSRVNYWGRTGIRTEKPLRLLTLDDRDITCPECKAAMRRKKSHRELSEKVRRTLKDGKPRGTLADVVDRGEKRRRH